MGRSVAAAAKEGRQARRGEHRYQERSKRSASRAHTQEARRGEGRGRRTRRGGFGQGERTAAQGSKRGGPCPARAHAEAQSGRRTARGDGWIQRSAMAALGAERITGDLILRPRSRRDGEATEWRQRDGHDRHNAPRCNTPTGCSSIHLWWRWLVRSFNSRDDANRDGPDEDEIVGGFEFSDSATKQDKSQPAWSSSSLFKVVSNSVSQ